MDIVRLSHVKTLVISLLCLCFFPSMQGQNWIASRTALPESKLRRIENKAFQKGELLSYRIHYGLVTAAYATLEVKPQAKWEKNRKCYHIVCKAESAGAFDLVYRIRDTYESFCDEDALVSWRFNRDIQEGKYFSYREIHFDQLNQKAYYHKKNKEVVPYDVPANVQDVISTFYYARAVYPHDELEKGDFVTLTNFIDETLFELKAQVMGRESIKIDGKKYNTLRLNVMIEEAGLLTDGSKITLWVSDDKNLIPIRFKSRLMIGALKADIVDYKNLKHPLAVSEED